MIIDLYDAIYTLLSNDSNVLNYLQVDDLLDNSNFYSDKSEPERILLAKAIKIQRQRIPKQLIESLPIVTFYSIPSGRDRLNDRVLNARFMIDIYTENNVDLALKISKCLYDLLHEQFLNVSNTNSFKGYWVDGYESPTNDADTYCFTDVYELSISLDI